MYEIMLKAFAIIWLIIAFKRMISRIKLYMMGEEAAKEHLMQLVDEMMDMFLMMEELPVRVVTVLIILILLLTSLLNLGGLFFAGLCGRTENIDKVCILFFAIMTILDYAKQYPGIMKFKQYVEDGLEKEVMERRIIELVDKKQKIRGIGDMASVGAVLGALYLCTMVLVS